MNKSNTQENAENCAFSPENYITFFVSVRILSENYQWVKVSSPSKFVITSWR